MNLNWIWKAFALGAGVNQYAFGQNAQEDRKPYTVNCNKENFIAGLRAFTDNTPSYQTRNDFLNCAPSGRQSYIDCGLFEKWLGACKINVLNLDDSKFDAKCANQMIQNGLEKRLRLDVDFENEPCVIKYQDKANYEGLAKLRGRRRN